jgi:hypothetical protein
MQKTIATLFSALASAHLYAAAQTSIDLYSSPTSPFPKSSREYMDYDVGKELNERFTSTEIEVTNLLPLTLPDGRKLKIHMPVSDFLDYNLDFIFPTDESLPTYSGRLLYGIKVRACLQRAEQGAAANP